MKKKDKKKIIIPLVIALMLSSTACSNNNEEQFMDTFNQKTFDVNTEATSTDEEFEYDSMEDFLNDPNRPRLDYEVNEYDTSGFDSAQIYNAKPLEYTNEYLMDFANKAFDENTINVCKPMIASNQKELTTVLEELDAFEENDPDNRQMPYYYRFMIEQALDQYSEEMIATYDANSCIVRSLDDSEAAFIKGEINNTEYAMVYSKSSLDSASGYANYPPLFIMRMTPSAAYNNSVDDQFEATDSLYGDNPVDKESAQKKAEEYLAQIGFDDFTVVDYGKRVCKTEDATQNVYDGYSFSFTRQINGNNCIITQTMSLMDYDERFMDPHKEDDYDDISGNEEVIRVDVDSEGIVLIEFYNMYEIGAPINNDEKIISYEQALDALSNSLILRLNENGDEENFNVRLSYNPMKYKDGYAIIPVWIFERTDSSNQQSYMPSYMETSDIPVAIDATNGHILMKGDNSPYIYSMIFSERVYEN